MIDPTKPVITRDGRPARILCTDFKSSLGRSLIVAYDDLDGNETYGTRFPSGNVYRNGNAAPIDIINKPAIVTVHVYQHSQTKGLFASSNLYQEHRLLKTVEVEVNV
jgi:hypothetical protein